jgi:hypothetical protein
MLESIYNVEDVKLTKIYNELQDLNNNITGLVTSILRTGGIGGMDVNTDYLKGGARLNWESQGTLGGPMTDWMSVTPLGKWLNNLLGSWGESIFGGGVERSITGQGIEIGNTIIKDILAGIDISARQYTHVTEVHKGGWFSSDWTSGYMVYGALDKNVTDMLTLVFKNIGNTLIMLSKELGASTEAVLNYVFKTTQINLQGMTGEQMNKALQEYISNISDTAVEDLFGTLLKGYQKLNEGLMETAVRLITDKAIIMQYLEMTNQAFHGSIPDAIKFSETLITIAGGLEKLTDAMQTYYDAFFSDAEKQTKLKDQLTAMMGQYGFDLPGTRGGYRSLVESLNLTTEAGQAAYVALMQMSKGADEYYKYLETAKGNIRPEDYATAEAYRRALATPHFAEGGYTSGGWGMAGESGAELINFGSPARIYSNKDSKSLLNTDELISEIRQLRQEMGEANFAIATNTGKLRLLDRWNGEGMPSDRGY